MGKTRCVSCDSWKTEIHHIKTRGAYPELANKPYNHMYLCRNCHHQAHHIGLNVFYTTNHKVRAYLLDLGWEIDEFTGKWWYNDGGYVD